MDFKKISNQWYFRTAVVISILVYTSLGNNLALSAGFHVLPLLLGCYLFYQRYFGKGYPKYWKNYVLVTLGFTWWIAFRQLGIL